MSKLDALVFTNRRGQQLVGVLHHGAGAGPRPCLVVCHGFAGTKLGGGRRFVTFARVAATRGVSVLRFDFAGSGDSDGELADLTLANQGDDIRAAVAAVADLGSIDIDRIGLLGHCLGAVSALTAALGDRRVGRVVAWAPFLDLGATLRRLVGEDAYALLAAGEPADFLYNDQLFTAGPALLASAADFDLARAVGALDRPLLVVHGSEDATVPLAQAERLVAAAWVAGVPAQLAVLDGAHHSFPYHQEELFATTLDWLDHW